MDLRGDLPPFSPHYRPEGFVGCASLPMTVCVDMVVNRNVETECVVQKTVMSLAYHLEVGLGVDHLANI